MLKGRLQVVDLFKHHNNYSLAKAKVFLIQGQDTVSINRKQAIKLLLKAIRTDVNCIFSKKIIALMARILSFR